MRIKVITIRIYNKQDFNRFDLSIEEKVKFKFQFSIEF